MKRVLIISPYFVPFNTADSQRVRISLSFFKDFGWAAEVVCVAERYVDMPKDDLLLQSLPADCIIHKVEAFSKQWTSKFGLGSLALRSMWFYRKKVMLLLQIKNYDLIYFSTTEFPVCVLGRYWKKRFGVPYIIDMQDAWHSTYYQDKPKKDRPKKYWFSYRLHRFLEPLAMQNCNGLISVSQAYLDSLQQRYPQLKNKPCTAIPFGAFIKDFEIAQNNYAACLPAIQPKSNQIQVVYVGRGGKDLHQSINLVFKVLKDALQNEPEIYSRLHFYFIGTSYAPKALAEATISPVAAIYGVENQVTEITDRIGFYHTINTLLAADALFLPGSNDPEYSASKIYPYLLSAKPLLAIVNPESPVKKILEEYGAKNIYNFKEESAYGIAEFLKSLVHNKLKLENYNTIAVNKYSAKSMTLKQCLLFNQVVNAKI